MSENYDFNQSTSLDDIRWKSIERADKLTCVILDLPPAEHIYLRMLEVRRCYLSGLNSAAVVMCRSLIENTLQELVGELKPNKTESIYFEKLVRVQTKRHGGFRRPQGLENHIHRAEARELLNRVLAASAHQIRKIGNEILHDAKTITEEQTLKIVSDTYEILSALSRNAEL